MPGRPDYWHRKKRANMMTGRSSDIDGNSELENPNVGESNRVWIAATCPDGR